MKKHWLELADHHAELSEYFGKLADWHSVVSWRQTDAAYFRSIENEHFAIALTYRRMAQDSQERGDLMRSIVTSIVLVFFALFLVALMPVRAQGDAPLSTNTPLDATAIPVTATLNGVPVGATVAPVATPAPPIVITTPDNTQAMFYIFTAVIFGLLAVIALVLRPLIVQLGASAPSWAVESAFSAGQNLLKSAQNYASTTPSPIDDDIVAELQKQIASIKDQIEALRPPATLPPPSTPTTDGSGGIG